RRGDPALLPGDNTNALSLAALRLDTFLGGQTPADSLRTLLQEFGDRAFAANASASSDGIATAQLADLRQSLSGVSIDEEMTLLMQFRQSYSAAATIIRTADELTQEIIALKR
ncbi:MAG: flagellar hook-associated protein FlgK, partial [Myxococcales bacterium]|nr:flagellar hook-associated protein FlgK [Myxococcales bacterium]